MDAIDMQHAISELKRTMTLLHFRIDMEAGDILTGTLEKRLRSTYIQTLALEQPATLLQLSNITMSFWRHSPTTSNTETQIMAQ